MRQISPATNLVLACLSALGLLATLGLPWYAPPVTDGNEYDGPVERTAFSIAHAFKGDDRALTGTDVLGNAKPVFFIIAAAIIVLAAIAAVPAARSVVREVLRAVAIAAPLIVFYLALDRPGEKALDLHWGLFVALGVALFTASAAWHGSGIRKKGVPVGTWEGRGATTR